MDILAESAARITVLAFGVVVVLRALNIRSPRVAHRVWAAVVVVMLLLPIFVAWGPEFAVPLLSSDAASTLRLPVADRVAAAASNEIPIESPFDADRAPRRITWATAAGAVYVAGVGFFLLRLVAGSAARSCNQARSGSREWKTHPFGVYHADYGRSRRARGASCRRTGRIGTKRSCPRVFTHEEEHARARDPLVGFVALLNRAVFWFHPLAWWLVPEIGRLSEEACDAVVISRGHDSHAYSTCLLRFARRVADAGRRIGPMATAMPGSGLQNRLQMLSHPQPVRASIFRLAVAVALSLGTCCRLHCGNANSTARTDRAVSTRSSGLAPQDIGALRGLSQQLAGRPRRRCSSRC